MVAGRCHLPFTPGSYHAAQIGSRDTNIIRIKRAAVPTIGVVVPALALGGGVPAVADFLCTQIERSQRYRYRLYSLATSSRDDCSVRLSSPSTWRRNPRVAAGRWRNREFTHFGSVGAEFEFRRVAPSRLLRRAIEDCDLVQVVAGSAAPALTLTGCGKPIVLQVATRAIVERRKVLLSGSLGLRTWRRLMTRLIDRCDLRALRMVDAVMVENQWMLEHARAVVNGARTSVQNAPPGVDCDRFAPLRGRAARLLDDPYFLFVGRLSDPRKNVALLCRAYSILCAQFADPPPLLLAGHGNLPEAAKSELADPRVRQRVKCIGEPSSEALRTLYQGATLLAVPSDEEGFGMVIVEAMACGVPVVATRCGGPEEIINDGGDGYLVPLDDAQGLAARLRMLCDPPVNQRMSEAARNTAVSRFSATVAFGPFLQTYDRLLQ
jgi:D-inositol-3-phosphate glycosyltransferase